MNFSISISILFLFLGFGPGCWSLWNNFDFRGSVRLGPDVSLIVLFTRRICQDSWALLGIFLSIIGAVRASLLPIF